MSEPGQANPVASSVSSTAPELVKKPPQNATRSSIGTVFQMKTEIPAVPISEPPAFALSLTDDKSAGNFNFTTELLEKGFIGYWRKRLHTAFEPTPVFIDPMNYFIAIQTTLYGMLKRFLEAKNQLTTGTIQDLVTINSNILACGCCLMTYMKVRYLIASELPSFYQSSNLKRPRAKEALPLPTGFAFAIQQLGIVNVADSQTERIFIPLFPNTGHTTGIPTPYLQGWNPNAYAQAVEYARNLGLQFATVDLKKKDGSAWWLFRQTYEEEVFELQCPIPEVNFTKAMAVTHAMFLDGNELNPSRTFVNIQPLGDDNFGTMLRNPHLGIHLSCYEAISHEANDVVTNV